MTSQLRNHSGEIPSFLRKVRAEQERNLANIETELFGGNDRVGGELTKVADPKLVWLYDLHWEKYGRDGGEGVGRFYHTHVDYVLNPKAYWSNVRTKMKKALKQMAATSVLTAAAIGSWTGVAMLVKAAVHQSAQAWVHSFPSSRLSSFERVKKPQSLSSTSQGAASGKIANEHECLFSSTGSFHPDQMEFPVLEDLQNASHVIGLLSKVSSPLTISSEVPFEPTQGRFWDCHALLDGSQIQVDVIQDGVQLLQNIDFVVVRSPRGYHFIELLDGDNVPWLYSSQIHFTVRMEAERNEEETVLVPAAPLVTPTELHTIADKLAAAHFGEKLTQAIRDLAQVSGADLYDLSGVLQKHSVYSQHEAQVRADGVFEWLAGGWSGNYGHRFDAFIDQDRQFAADCDVSAALLQSMTRDIAAARDWKFEIRPSIHRKQTSTFFYAGQLHGRLYGWKEGYERPLILDPTG